MQITNTSSTVTGQYSINIRGLCTITGSNEALVVIDNVISSGTGVVSSCHLRSSSLLMLLRAVLELLYMALGGINGVVVVTTKRVLSLIGCQLLYIFLLIFEAVGKMPERQSQYGQGWSGDKINVENGAWGWAFNDPKYAGTMQPVWYSIVRL